jgi:predicted amidohydrolase YtcJ
MKKITIPLLKDHHNHPSIYAVFHDCLNLQEVKHKGDAVSLLQALDRERVSVVLGWNTGYYLFTEEDLKSFSPVVIVNISLHSFIMNASAEDMLRDRYPDIVSNYADASWYERNFPHLLIFLAEVLELNVKKLKIFFDYLQKKGVYYAEEMHLPGESAYSIFREALLVERTAFWTNAQTFKTLTPETQKGIAGIKLFTDGAVGARSAAMTRPFTGGEIGELLHSDDELYVMLKEVASFRKAAAVHALGELAPAQVVRTVRKLSSRGITIPLLRMEHCQFIDESTAREAREMGIVISMQPNFSTDSTIYSDRLHPMYLERNNPLRMLIDRVGYIPGEDLLFGSDGMPQGVEEALRSSLFPPFPGQRLTLDEFIAGYCMPDTSTGQIELEIENKTVKIIR